MASRLGPLGAMLIAEALSLPTHAWPVQEGPTKPNALTTSTQTQGRSMTTPSTPEPADAEKKGRNDFDFLVGRWRTVQKRSTKPLQDDAPWETFDATIHMEKLPGDLGNIDSMVAPTWRPGWVGVTIRIFNGETGLWSIYWLAGKTGGIDSATGQLTVPVVGKFENGVGIFESNEVIEGKALRVRYTWTRVDADNVTWQQAFSFDGGKTWKPNWEMAGSRVK